MSYKINKNLTIEDFRAFFDAFSNAYYTARYGMDSDSKYSEEEFIATALSSYLNQKPESSIMDYEIKKDLNQKDFQAINVAFGKAYELIRNGGEDGDDYEDDEICAIALAFYLDPNAEIE